MNISVCNRLHCIIFHVRTSMGNSHSIIRRKEEIHKIPCQFYLEEFIFQIQIWKQFTQKMDEAVWAKYQREQRENFLGGVAIGYPLSSCIHSMDRLQRQENCKEEKKGKKSDYFFSNNKKSFDSCNKPTKALI